MLVRLSRDSLPWDGIMSDSSAKRGSSANGLDKLLHKTVKQAD